MGEDLQPEVLGAPALPGVEAERVVRADGRLAERVDTPARASHPELERLRPAASEPKRDGARSVGELDSPREGECQLDEAFAGEPDRETDLVLLDRPVALELHFDSHCRVASKRETECDECAEGRAERDELRPAEYEPGEQAERRERRVGAEPRRRGAVQGSGSAGGVGTVSSASRTTSSPRMRCTHSSGRSVSRWASAGTATAFTSSGVT